MSRGKKKSYGHLGDSPQFAMMHKDLLESDAYACLSHSARALLPEVVMTYGKVSRGDTEPAVFCFTYDNPKAPIGEQTFRRGMKDLRDKGFLDVKPEDQIERMASAILYRFSNRWKHWKPKGEEAKKLQQFRRNKKKRLEEKRKRKSDLPKIYELSDSTISKESNA